MKQWLLFEMSKNSLEEKPTEAPPKGTRCQGPLELLKLGPPALLKETCCSTPSSQLTVSSCLFLTRCLLACSFTHMLSIEASCLSVLEQNQFETYQAWVLGRTPPQQHTSALEEQRVIESANAQDSRHSSPHQSYRHTGGWRPKTWGMIFF